MSESSATEIDEMTSALPGQVPADTFGLKNGLVISMVLLIYAVICGLVVYNGYSDRSYFVQTQAEMSKVAVSSAVRQLEHLLGGLDRSVALLAQANRDALVAVVKRRNRQAALDKLKRSFGEQLPDVLSIQVSNPESGFVAGDSGDLLPGLDMRAKLAEYERLTIPVYMHPQKDATTAFFSIIARVPDLPGYFLTISLGAEPLLDLLRETQPQGYQLLIMQRSWGQRTMLSSKGFAVDDGSVTLPQGASKTVWISRPVSGSPWRVVNLAQFGLFESNLLEIAVNGALILGLSLLTVSVTFRLLMRRDQLVGHFQEQLLEANSELRYQSLHDKLTGLPNRSLLEERLKQKAQEATRSGQQFVLILASLKGLKRVNKLLGYEVGDQVLQKLGQRISDKLREVDTVARFEGDVFAIVADTGGKAQAELIATKVLESVDRPLDIGDAPLGLTAAIGIATFPSQGEDVTTLIKRADAAVSLAKTSRDRPIVFSTEGDLKGLDRLSLVSGLSDAIQLGQLSMVYQPQLALTEPDKHSFEALARWKHPVHGDLPCDLWIPLVEQTRNIIEMTHWSIETCLLAQKKLLDKGLEVKVAINLSARLLEENDFPLWVERTIGGIGVSPDQVSFEITESSMMADPDKAMQILLRLAAIGVGLSVDDFGVGQSSLAYISRLPVDELKVDKSFVQNMTESDSDLAIVRATIDLAHDLGLSVVAEGVETLEQATSLRQMECDFLQGYYISRPMPENQLEKWISAHSG